MAVDVKAQSAKCGQASSKDKVSGMMDTKGWQATPRHRQFDFKGSVHGKKGLRHSPIVHTHYSQPWCTSVVSALDICS